MEILIGIAIGAFLLAGTLTFLDKKNRKKKICKRMTLGEAYKSQQGLKRITSQVEED